MNQTYDVVVIGGGPAGLTAAMYTARAQLSTLLLEAEMLGGNTAIAGMIDNYPGFPLGVSGSELISDFQRQAERFGVEIRYEEAVALESSGVKKTVHTVNAAYECRTVIIAAGAKRRQLNVPGEADFLGRGVSYCATCDGPFFKGANIAVVGGGDSAVKEALYLASLASKVYLIHRREHFTANKTALSKLREQSNVEILTNQIVEQVKGSALLETLELKDVLNGTRKTLMVKGLFISVGIVPGEPVRGFPETDENGYILSHDHVFTSLAGVFVAGDIRNKPYRQVATAVGDGTMAGMAANEYLQET